MQFLIIFASFMFTLFNKSIYADVSISLLLKSYCCEVIFIAIKICIVDKYHKFITIKITRSFT